MAELAAGVQEPEVGAAVVGVGQLVHAVPVQVDDGGLPRGPGQEDGPALRRDGPVVGEVVVGDDQAVIAEQVAEKAYRHVSALRSVGDGQEHVGLPDRLAAARRGLGRHQGGIEVSIGGEVEAHRPVVDQPAAQLLRAVSAVADDLRRLQGPDLCLCQGHSQLQPLRRVHRGDGGLFRDLVGDEPVVPVPQVPEGHAAPVPPVGAECLPVIQMDQIPLPPPSGDVHLWVIVGVPVGVVPGVVFLPVGEALQPHLIRLLHRQARVLGEHRVHVGPAVLLQRTDQLPVSGPIPLLRQLLVADGLRQAGAAVKECKEVDVLRAVVEGVQKLVADVEIVPVEPFLGEVRQFRPGERVVAPGQRGRTAPVVLRAGGGGEGGGAGHGGQDQGQGEGQGGGPPGLGDAADPVLHLPLAGGHGGGGEEGVAAGPPHRHQGQQGPAVGQPLLLVQPRQHRLVAGQLPVGPGGQSRRPHQGVEPVDHQADAPQQGPQGVQVPPVGQLVGDDVALPLLRGRGGGGQVDGGAQEPHQAGGGQPPLRQVYRHRAPLHGIGPPPPAELPPEAQVPRQEPQPRQGHAAVPEVPQQLRRRQLPGVAGDGLPVGRQHRVAEAVAGLHHLAGLGLARRRDLRRRGAVQGQDVDRTALQPAGRRLHRGLRRGQHSEACRRQAHGDQQPGQHQQPQGVLGPPGDLFPEHPPQDQQGQDQHRGRDQNLCHGFSPPFSKMADSSARSSSVRARLSTMALTSSPRLPP